jgi:hypothetical protein
MKSIKQFGVLLLFACLVFPSYGFAKKSTEEIQRKSVARKLKKEDEKKKKVLKKSAKNHPIASFLLLKPHPFLKLQRSIWST